MFVDYLNTSGGLFRVLLRGWENGFAEPHMRVEASFYRLE